MLGTVGGITAVVASPSAVSSTMVTGRKPTRLSARTVLSPIVPSAPRVAAERGSVTTAPDGTLQVCSTGHQGSGLLHSMVQANGLIVLHHHQGDVAAGDVVDVMMFDGVI